MPVLAVVGIAVTGERDVLAFRVGDRENEQARTRPLRGIPKREASKRSACGSAMGFDVAPHSISLSFKAYIPIPTYASLYQLSGSLHILLPFHYHRQHPFKTGTRYFYK
jgi:hypothetical protein